MPSQRERAARPTLVGTLSFSQHQQSRCNGVHKVAASNSAAMRFSYSSVLFSLLALSSNALSAASSLTVALPSSVRIGSLPSSTYATLTTISQPNGPLKAPLSHLSTFVFNDISLPTASTGSEKPISYLLDIHSKSHVFAPYRVDVSSETGKIIGVWGTYRGNPWDNKGAEKIISGGDYEPGVVVVEAKAVSYTHLTLPTSDLV